MVGAEVRGGWFPVAYFCRQVRRGPLRCGLKYIVPQWALIGANQNGLGVWWRGGVRLGELPRAKAICSNRAKVSRNAVCDASPLLIIQASFYLSEVSEIWNKGKNNTEREAPHHKGIRCTQGARGVEFRSASAERRAINRPGARRRRDFEAGDMVAYFAHISRSLYRRVIDGGISLPRERPNRRKGKKTSVI